ncbi:MAG: PhoH family protein [Bacteroidia bacterium]|nr:PhoH family protein [Bacteroidia bacterium]
MFEYLCAKKVKKTRLTERVYTLEIINPQIFYGVNNAHINVIKSRFPKLQFIARGDEVKVVGEEAELELFATKMDLLEKYYIKRGELNVNIISEVFGANAVNGLAEGPEDGSTLLIGTRGQKIKARTANQQAMVKAAEKNDIIFAIGPAGTGKTYTAVAIAVRALRDREIRKIILTRPAVEAGDNLGFLPGDLKEKVDPYLRPLYDALEDMIPGDKLKSMIESRTVEVAPLAFMRGRTLDNCYVILDEAQNSTSLQLKMFLTRMGPNAKMIITGDLTQIDLPKKHMSGLKQAVDLLSNIKGISKIVLNTDDVVRHELVKEIVKAYDKAQSVENTPNE